VRRWRGEVRTERTPRLLSFLAVEKKALSKDSGSYLHAGLGGLSFQSPAEAVEKSSDAGTRPCTGEKKRDH